MSKDKAREFWLEPTKLVHGFLAVASDVQQKNPEKYIHVIEFSAYEELESKIAECVAALEVYAMTNETFPEYGDVAREVLAKVKK
jgi:hypothetical protein